MERKVAGIDIKTVRPIVKKERAGVKDPVRFPDVINGYENETKRNECLMKISTFYSETL